MHRRKSVGEVSKPTNNAWPPKRDSLTRRYALRCFAAKMRRRWRNALEAAQRAPMQTKPTPQPTMS